MMSLSNSESNPNSFDDSHFDDDKFHPWNIDGLDQCGSDIYKQNRSVSRYSEEFKVLYEPDKKEGSDKFVRIYGEDKPDNKASDDGDGDDEFKPFKTGITYFDKKMSSGKSGKLKSKYGHDLSDTSDDSDDLARSDESAIDDSKDLSKESNSDGADRAKSSSSESAVKRTFEEAYKKGYEEGQSKGYEDGLARGMEDGFQSGHEKGSQEGYDAGFQKGEGEGYDAGFQKGEEDGKVIADAKALEIVSSLEDILQKAENSWQNSIKTHEPKILSLICKIAEKIVFAKVELDDSIVKGSILNALSTMPEPEDIILNISPDDYEYVEMIKDDFFANIKSLKSISVISNPSVQRGGCKIESSQGKVETDIQTRLEQVFTSVMGARVS
ncbi:MAG: hypothetical protein HQK68_08250 [Desulfamplus sp.]|nr:hypothetical protein [Desulfamplus sp.]